MHDMEALETKASDSTAHVSCGALALRQGMQFRFIGIF